MYRFALVPESISENKTATWPILRDPNSITIAFLWENLTGLRFPVQLISRSSELRFSSKLLQPHQSMSFQGRQLIFLFSLNICFWLCWVFTAASGLSLVAASRGYFLAVVCRLLTGGFSYCRARALGHVGFRSCSTGAQQLQLLSSRAQAQQLRLRCRGLVALWYVGSSRTRDQTCDPYAGRRILNHWISREVQLIFTVAGWTSNSQLYVTI